MVSQVARASTCGPAHGFRRCRHWRHDGLGPELELAHHIPIRGGATSSRVRRQDRAPHSDHPAAVEDETINRVPEPKCDLPGLGGCSGPVSKWLKNPGTRPPGGMEAGHRVAMAPGGQSPALGPPDHGREPHTLPPLVGLLLRLGRHWVPSYTALSHHDHWLARCWSAVRGSRVGARSAFPGPPSIGMGRPRLQGPAVVGIVLPLAVVGRGDWCDHDEQQQAVTPRSRSSASSAGRQDARPRS